MPIKTRQPAWMNTQASVRQNKQSTNGMPTTAPAWMKPQQQPTGSFFSGGQAANAGTNTQVRLPDKSGWKQYEKLPIQPTGTFFSGGVDYNVKPGRVPYDPRMMASGYYKTGEGEQMAIQKGDQIIRLTPNSYLAPVKQTKKSPMQTFMDTLMGRNQNNQPGGFAGVRG